MNENIDSIQSSLAWFSRPGPNSDVVISSRVRLARNLANYPFPEKFRTDDSERVQTLVFDSFQHFVHPEEYQTVETSTLDPLGLEILLERGLLDKTPCTGLVTRNDGYVACLVNSKDHVRLASFSPGLSCTQSFSVCRGIDDAMQTSLQFAASYDFGFLTSSVFDAGSGLKSSVRVHLPSVSFSGEITKLIPEIRARGFSIRDCYGSGSVFASSLGAYYEVASTSSFSGSELDQIANITSLASYIVELEHKIRESYADNKPTVVRNMILRSYSLAKFSLLMPLRDAIDIISTLKWGHDIGMLQGISTTDFSSLLYRIQPGHLGFLLRTGNFDFEEDIQNLKIDRLRAIVLQKAIEKTVFVS